MDLIAFVRLAPFKTKPMRIAGSCCVRRCSMVMIALSGWLNIVGDQSGSTDMLALSFDHLPPHLKDCYLYLGGFPEDHKFPVTRLIWLWMAEGFIQASGNRSLEEIGKEYLMELVDRNLVVVADRKFNGAIKTCSVHDLLRELCMEKAKNEHFCLKIHDSMSMPFNHYKLRRIFTYYNLYDHNPQPIQSLQSLLYFSSTLSISVSSWYVHSYPLLMVLDLQSCYLPEFPKSIELLVFLRYLAFRYWGECFPSSICNLWNLQILIIRSSNTYLLPPTISNLVNLRHFRSDGIFRFESFEKPMMNLQTISRVEFADGAKHWIKYIPGIKKLSVNTHAGDDHDFEPLTSLETLMWSMKGQLEYPKIQLRLPAASLKNLTLERCKLPWSDIAIIQSLPNLEVLKILWGAFWGPRWETGEEQFRKLKFLKLQVLGIRQWEASSMNFPCLERLVVDGCFCLEEIPLEIGDIPTLELIHVNHPSTSVVESLDKIREEQRNVGNYDLNINVTFSWAIPKWVNSD